MQLKSLFAAAAAAALARAQDSPPTLANALSSTDDLSSLNMLLGQYPNLLTTLGNASNITVFAPSNDALRPLLDNSTSMSMAMGNQSDYLQALLQYHVVNGSYYSQNISNTPAFVHTLLNNTQYSNVTGGQVVGVRKSGGDDDSGVVVISGLGARSNVTQANVQVSNGVVHIIDRVLTIPQNLSTTALDANLTALAGALTATDLTNALDEASDITVFAPTNQAFSDIGSLLSNLSTSQLTSILEYHVINGTVAYSSLLANGTNVDTMEGQPVNVTIDDGAVFINSARVILADVLVSEGVVHVIDSVLNPNGTAAPNPDDDNGTPAYSGASSGLVPYTTLAPINTSFNTDLSKTTDAVAAGYTSAPTNALTSAQSSVASAMSSSTGAAAMPTGAIGGAALFGGAMLLANI